MPQLASLVLTDRAATPVNHTFLPSDIKSGVGIMVASDGVPFGERTASVSLTKTAAGRRKAVGKLVLPVVQTATINGVSTPTVVRTAYAEVTFSFDASSSTQERKDAVGMLQSMLDESKWTDDVFVDLQGVY